MNTAKARCEFPPLGKGSWAAVEWREVMLDPMHYVIVSSFISNPREGCAGFDPRLGIEI